MARGSASSSADGLQPKCSQGGAWRPARSVVGPCVLAPVLRVYLNGYSYSLVLGVALVLVLHGACAPDFCARRGVLERTRPARILMLAVSTSSITGSAVLLLLTGKLWHGSLPDCGAEPRGHGPIALVLVPEL